MTYTSYDNAGTEFNPFDDFSYPINSLQIFELSQDRNTGYGIINTKL
jgi:hypothetical protein